MAMDMGIAQTILAQLGGRKFTMMTGAKNLVGHNDGLSFRLPASVGFAKNEINYVRVTLNWRDLYDVEFSRVRGHKATVVVSVSDVYADMLCPVFTRETGLQTSLGTMGR